MVINFKTTTKGAIEIQVLKVTKFIGEAWLRYHTQEKDRACRFSLGLRKMDWI